MNNKKRFLIGAIAATLVVAVAVQCAFATVLSIPFFSQRDGRWSGQTVPGTGGTIGTKGCAMASAAMGLGFRGADVNPAKLNQWLSNNRGYTSEGFIKWDVAARYNGRQWMTYEGPGRITSLADLSRQIDNRKLIIAESKRFPSHFVIIRGVTPDGKYGYYWDPWDFQPTQRRISDGCVDIGAGTRVFRY